MINLTKHIPHIAVPTSLIDGYFGTARPEHLLVYISLLADNSLTPAQLAQKLNQDISEVSAALEFWKKEGLLSFEGEKRERLIMDEPPLYTPDELEKYQLSSADVAELFAYGEHALGRLLKYDDVKVLFALYDYYELSLPVIKMLLDYCSGHNKLKINYIRKMGADWAEDGIDTVEKAQVRLDTFKEYFEILKAFGETKRNPTKTEIAYFEKWKNQYGMSIELIAHAADITVSGGKGHNLGYADTIMKNWHKAGVTRVDDIPTLDPKPKTVQKKEKKTPFFNFNQREQDYAFIEDLSLQSLEEEYGG